MKMLKMSGYPITNIRDYNKYFNVYDVLKYNKEFMIFISSHFANLSKIFSYCTAMVYIAIENCVPLFMRDNIYDSQININLDNFNSENYWNNPFAFCQTCNPSNEILNISKVIAKQFEAKIDDITLKKIMLITVAAFVFLDEKNIEPKIDLEKAKKSFCGKAENKPNNLYKVCFDYDMSDRIQTIKLEPSAFVYTCETFDENNINQIRTFRIEASRKFNSLSNRTVKISLGDKQIIIPAGEHIYVNTINGKIATILGKSQTKKGHTLQNTGIEKDVLKFDDEDNPILDFYGNEYMSSFDFLANDNSIVYINNLRLCLNKCTSRVLLEQLIEYTDINLVEVKLVNDKFYLLKNDGELLSNNFECNGKKNVYSIESVLRRV